MKHLFPLFLILLLSSCASVKKDAAEKIPLTLEPAPYSALPGWEDDPHGEALAAFSRSCARILKKDPGDAFGPVGGLYGDWQIPCLKLAETPPADGAAARRYFETWFAPWRAMAGDEEEGLFTGYYEASLKGSRARQGPYQYPLHLRPADLVMVDLGEFREELKGQRIAGRVRDGHLKPYEDRKAITEGKMPRDEDLSFVWVDDPVDAFFLHIQGSGRVLLDDGTALRAGYDGQNGHPYYAVGRELIKRGELDKDDVSMQSIRAWLDAHPDQAANLMNTNRSYIFFKELTEDGPQGGEGVALTPGRSLAVDRTQIAYGIPLWVDIEAPAPGEAVIRRLMIAQDTGGAIQGAVRGDYFWGYGPRAEALAGMMKAKGRYWLLLPKTVRPRP